MKNIKDSVQSDESENRLNVVIARRGRMCYRENR